MTAEERLRHRLESLLDESTRLLTDLQASHDRLVGLEDHVRAAHDPFAPDVDVDSDAVRHAADFHRAVPAADRLGLAAVAASEQWLEAAGTVDSAWFQDLADMFPRLDPSTVVPSWEESASNTGALMLYRGFRGEQMLGGMLENLDLPTPTGFEGFTFPDTTNNAGWDLMLHTEGGDVPAQVKIAADATPIRQHFASHPDVDVVFASSDAAADAARMEGVVVVGQGDVWPTDPSVDVVVDIGHTSAEVGNQVTDAIAGQTDAVDEVLDLFPLAALLFVGARVGYRLLDSDDDAHSIRQRGLQEAGDVLINSSVGELASALVADSVGAPVTIATALTRSAVGTVRSDIERSAKTAASRSQLLERLRQAM